MAKRTNDTEPRTADVRARLNDHMQHWLGGVPRHGEFETIVHPPRDEPGWDGVVRPIQGVIGPDGGVLSISPGLASLFDGVDPADVFMASASDDRGALSRLLGIDVGYGMPVFRWGEHGVDLPAAGTWVEADHPRIPSWLRPFNGGVLVAFDRTGRYMAGVGLKQHNPFAREIAVGTDMGYRGRGLATKLVAQAARAIMAAGDVPIYQHGRENAASARVADAAGLPDRGWQMLEIHPLSGGSHRD